MEQMTPEQAIQEIQTYMYSDCYLDAPSNDACKLAISALEKQVPKKTNRMMNRTYPDYSWFDQCPCCCKNVGDEKYCPDCGQTIDWSE